LLIVLLLALGMLLVACGGGETVEPAVEEEAPVVEEPAAEEPMAEEPAAEEPAMEDVTLRWRTRPDKQADIDDDRSVSDSRSESLPGINLEYDAGGIETASYQDVLKTELASGTAPDVFWIPGTDVADFATRGLIMDLREMANATEGYS